MDAVFVKDPLLYHSRRIIQEPDDFMDAVSGMSLQVNFQRRAEQASKVEQFQTPDWGLDFGEANVQTRVRGVLRGQWGSFCLTLGPGSASWNSQSAHRGSVCLLPPDQEVNGRTTAPYSWMTAAVPPKIWRRSLALAGLEEDHLRHSVVCQLSPLLFAQMKNRLRIVRHLLVQGDASSDGKNARVETSAFITDCFTTICEQASRLPQPSSALRNRARLVRQAEAWMCAHLDEPIQVPDVCLALRVSRRELEYAFRTIFDQSPRHYLQTLRLHAIRRALLHRDAPAHTIIQIAYANGVTHLGRFAEHYRVLFGEKPSETLRR